jgi:hypothetical protein
MEITIHGNETPVQLLALSRFFADLSGQPHAISALPPMGAPAQTGVQHFTAHTEVATQNVQQPAAPRGRGRPPAVKDKASTEQATKETLQQTEQVIEKIEQEKAQVNAPAVTETTIVKATKDDVTKALETLRDTFEAEGIGKVRSLLQELGFNKISELPEDKYGDVIAAANKAIAEKKAA